LEGKGRNLHSEGARKEKTRISEKQVRDKILECSEVSISKEPPANLHRGGEKTATINHHELRKASGKSLKKRYSIRNGTKPNKTKRERPAEVNAKGPRSPLKAWEEPEKAILGQRKVRTSGARKKSERDGGGENRKKDCRWKRN